MQKQHYYVQIDLHACDDIVIDGKLSWMPPNYHLDVKYQIETKEKNWDTGDNKAQKLIVRKKDCENSTPKEGCTEEVQRSQCKSEVFRGEKGVES